MGIVPPTRTVPCRVSCIASCGVLLCSAVSPVNSLSAQDTSVVRVLEPVACQGQTISRIEVHPGAPFSPDGGPKIVQRVERFLERMHSTTRESVIRRFLALRVGDKCTELRRQESERILRAQPFLVDATIVVYSDGNNGVVLDVITLDEISLVFDVRLSNKKPVFRGLRFGESNLAGRAVSATAGWEADPHYRDTYRADVVHYQFLGRPYVARVNLNSHSHGTTWQVQAAHPFITDLQRISWRTTTGAVEGFLGFIRPFDADASLKFKRTYSDIGGLFAFGPPGKLFLAGLSLSREREATASMPVIVSDTGIVPDTSTVLFNRYGTHQSSRVNLLLGYRDIRLMRVVAFDALEGTQDVRKGLQISSLFGKGFKILEDDEEDYFISAALYYGFGNPLSFAAFETLTERRRNLELDEWDGVLASGRAAWYFKPGNRHTIISSFEFSGGWRQRVPFQLSFQNKQGGLRGFHRSHLAGGQRLVYRLEERYLLRPVKQFASLGLSGFIDAGKMWAGDVPFGVTTGVNAAVGVGLLAAVPPKSRRLWRLDFAMPLTDRGQSRFEVRLWSTDMTRFFWREPGDVQTSRERSVPLSVYSWP